MPYCGGCGVENNGVTATAQHLPDCPVEKLGRVLDRIEELGRASTRDDTAIKAAFAEARALDEETRPSGRSC